MVFSSNIFLLYFLPIFLLVYGIIGKKLKNYWILFASIFFYAWGETEFVFLILFTSTIDYLMVGQMHRMTNVFNKKLWLISSLSLNLGLLAYFKYANFFIENVNSVLFSFGFHQITWTKIALPIGISFFIFQSITYAIDVYRGVFPPVKKFSQYLLFILSFPQLIAGPIVKFNDIATQLENRNENIDDRLLGFYRFCIGLAKKVLIANVMAEQADLILNGELNSLSTIAVWTGILAYTFQIYFDFAGYSDMAIGLGRMIGFKFPENFDFPYMSKNISEFWRRWHMTLGSFMKEYLYIPLGGNRVSSKSRLYFNLGLVFILSGLWHGASWNYVLWGAFHGFFLILDRVFLLNVLQKVGVVFSNIFTFFIVMIGWAIFRMENFEEMKIVLIKMFSFDFSYFPNLNLEFIVILTLAIIFSFGAFGIATRMVQYFFTKQTMNLYQHIGTLGLSFILMTLCVASLTASEFNPFIYFRF